MRSCELLLNLGAKINASNNAGDRPWHFARNMGHNDVMEFLEKVGGARGTCDGSCVSFGLGCICVRCRESEGGACFHALQGGACKTMAVYDQPFVVCVAVPTSFTPICHLDLYALGVQSSKRSCAFWCLADADTVVQGAPALGGRKAQCIEERQEWNSACAFCSCPTN